MTYSTRESYRQAWDAAYQSDPPIALNADLELSSACNAKCTFCLYGDRDWDASMKENDWDGKPKKRFMPTEMALRIIDECAAIGVPAIKFNFRGESVLHRDYGDIVEYAQHKIQDGKAIFLELLANTNSNIPDSLWDSGIRGLMACTKVMISLDSMDLEVYSKIRVGLSLDSAKRTIDELIKRRHPNLWVRRVVCKDNKDEPFVESVKTRWPTGLKVSEHYSFDRNHYSNQAVHGEDYSTWERTPCGYPSQRIVVEASGRYSPCCIAWSGEFYETGLPGKWPELGLKDYWESEWRKNLAGELRENIFKNRACSSCTSFMSYKRPERERVADVEA